MIEEWYLTSEYCRLSVFFDLCFFPFFCFIVSIEIRDLLIRILEFGLIVLLYCFLYSRPICGDPGDGMELAWAELSSGIPSRLRSLYGGHVLVQIVARGTAFIWNTDVLKQENPSCGGWTRILLDPCLV